MLMALWHKWNDALALSLSIFISGCLLIKTLQYLIITRIIYIKYIFFMFFNYTVSEGMLRWGDDGGALLCWPYSHLSVFHLFFYTSNSERRNTFFFCILLFRKKHNYIHPESVFGCVVCPHSPSSSRFQINIHPSA